MKQLLVAALALLSLGAGPPKLGGSGGGGGNLVERSVTAFTSAFAIGSSSGGIQEAIDFCEHGVGSAPCRVFIDNLPLEMEAGVVVGTFDDVAEDTINGLTIECLSGSPAIGGTDLRGIYWDGPDDANGWGGTMFDIRGVSGFTMRYCGIYASDGVGSNDAGLIMSLRGSNAGGGVNNALHMATLDRVHMRGGSARETIGYLLWGHDADGNDFEGVVASATSNTLTAAGSPGWTTDEWNKTCGDGDDFCYVTCMSGPCIGQTREISGNDADTLTVTSVWAPGAEPDATSTFIIDDLLTDHNSDDQVDFINVDHGSGRDLAQCGIVASQQSVHNWIHKHECAQWSGTAGWSVYAGQFAFLESYGGNSVAGSVDRPFIRSYAADTNGVLSPADIHVLGGRFEMATANLFDFEWAGDIGQAGVTIENVGVNIQGDPDPNDVDDDLVWLRIVNAGHWSVRDVSVNTQLGYGAKVVISNLADGFANSVWEGNSTRRWTVAQCETGSSGFCDCVDDDSPPSPNEDGYCPWVQATLTNQRVFAPRDVPASRCPTEMSNDRDLDEYFDVGECLGNVVAVPFSGINFDTTSEQGFCMPAFSNLGGALAGCATAGANLQAGFLVPGNFAYLKDLRCLVLALTGDGVGDSIGIRARYRDGTNATDSSTSLVVPTGAADFSYHSQAVGEVVPHLPGHVALQINSTDGDNSISDFDVSCTASFLLE